MITIDTLRADHVHAYGYFRETTPNIDSFAEDAWLFEKAVVPMATTLPSHVSIMTGTHPLRHGVVSNFRAFEEPLVTSDELQTAAQMLRGAGYQTAAFTSASPLCAESGINAGFAIYEATPPYSKEQRRLEIPAEETVNRAVRWLKTAEAPFFVWVHLFDPHNPYRAPPPFDRAFSDEPKLFDFLERQELPRSQARVAAKVNNQYDGEILYTDAQVGRLLQAMKDLELYEQTVIVLTADHGEGLFQHGVPFHTWLWNEQIFVPLIFRFPQGPRGREQGLASLVDILPTIEQGAGFPLTGRQFQGINLLRERRRDVLTQHFVNKRWPDPILTLTRPEWKYWYYEKKEDLLFDLSRDPHEISNVIGDHPTVGREMKGEVLRLMEQMSRGSPLRPRAEISEEQREQLRSLGYVE